MTRGQGVSRSLANENEIDQLLKKYGFEKVDTVAMPFREQARLFQQARHVVGAHGAGLTNISFRCGQPMSLIELFPSDHFGMEYFRISRRCHYTYRALMGTGSSHSGFTVDLERLESLVVSLLAAEKADEKPVPLTSTNVSFTN